MLTELLIYHCDHKDQIIVDPVLLSTEQLSELRPGSFFYYIGDNPNIKIQDIDQPCDTDQLFMVVVNGYSTTIEHFEEYIKVHNHVSVLEVATGEIYHENRLVWVHAVKLVNMQVFVQ